MVHRNRNLATGGGGAGATRSHFAPYAKKQGNGGVNAGEAPITDLDDAPKGEHLTERLTAETMKFIATHKDRPFFAVLAHYAVHTPIEAKAEITERYRKKLADQPAPALLYEAESAGENLVVQNNPTYAAMIESVDQGVGRLFELLRHLGIDQRTIVVLASHPGLHQVEDHAKRKCESTEGVELFHERKKGGKVVSPVDFIDIFPTLCDLAALPRPGQLQGVTLAPNLTDANYSARKFNSSIYRSKGALGHSIRTERYRYIEWIDQTSAQLVARDLFDFKQDPNGRKNVAGDPAYRDVVRDHSALLKTDTGGWTLLSRHRPNQRDPHQTP